MMINQPPERNQWLLTLRSCRIDYSIITIFELNKYYQITLKMNLNFKETNLNTATTLGSFCLDKLGLSPVIKTKTATSFNVIALPYIHTAKMYSSLS